MDKAEAGSEQRGSEGPLWRERRGTWCGSKIPRGRQNPGYGATVRLAGRVCFPGVCIRGTWGMKNTLMLGLFPRQSNLIGLEFGPRGSDEPAG